MERLRESRWRGTFDPPDAVHRFERALREPMLGRLRLEVLQQEFDLSVAQLPSKRHEEAGTPQVTVVLRNLVLQYEMIPERIPGKVRQDPMILMPVVTVVR